MISLSEVYPACHNGRLVYLPVDLIYLPDEIIIMPNDDNPKDEIFMPERVD